MPKKMCPSGKTFNDSVHGSIHMLPLCVKVIDTPEFQRLRYVKQLGVGFFVYPGAIHNRFEHCIGVSHLAGKLLDALQSNQEELDINDRDVLCVRMAGLCHDLGHGPFSHLWDQFMKEQGNTRHEHEEVSCQMFEHLLANNGFEIIEEGEVSNDAPIMNLTRKDVNFIKALIRGRRDAGDTGRGVTKGFLYDIVCNERNGIDVDKWEYLIRDSMHLGVAISFSYERLILYSRVIEVGNEGYQICFRDKVAGDVVKMFSMRFELHKTAYQHKVCLKLTRMLLDAFRDADDYITVCGRDGRRYKLSECAQDMTAFSQLTDDVINRILYAPAGAGDEGLLRAQELIKRVYRRKLYLEIGKVLLPENPTEDWEQIMRDQMVSHLASQEAKNYLKINQSVVSCGSKGSHPLERVGFYSKHEEFLGSGLIHFGIPVAKCTTWSLAVLCTDEDSVSDAKKAFRAAVNELQLVECSWQC